MQPDPHRLTEILGLRIPPLGFYDAPDPTAFEPLVRPAERTCMFAYFPEWLKGRTLLLTADRYGCGGAGSCLLGVESRSREQMISFLLDEEGLKRSREIMGRFVDERHKYHPRHGNLLVGPLRPAQYEHLRTVTFYVNPDQLAAFIVGAHYDSGPREAPVIAPFGSGCSQLLPVFDDLDAPRAALGATDSAMRRHLPADTLAFTVTKPMFQKLCELDERSFLYKSFWRDLQKARAQA
ncbi:MAG TPA: DUF169 domain-containing protein [Terriglobales bacterium]|nr:DUF169 domain-containing protein [Terriglobales bacterium]